MQQIRHCTEHSLSVAPTHPTSRSLYAISLKTTNKGLNSCHIDGQNKAIGLVPPGAGNSIATLWILNTTRSNLKRLPDSTLSKFSANDNFWRRIFPPIEDINQLLSERYFLSRTLPRLSENAPHLWNPKLHCPI